MTGSIAAYKSVILVRELVKSGAEVKVIMTPSALSFVTPLTFSTLSKHPVVVKPFEAETGEWSNHVDLALWADEMIIAPASANTIAKMAHGICDNVLMATYLSAKCPVYVAPAMDLDMYLHPATVANLKTLVSYGHTIIPAEDGELASGLVGKGRMAEPATILTYIYPADSHSILLNGKKILITAGPTYEALDPVRFIGNHSTGKMGFAIAECCAEQGAEVVLVSGPTHLSPKHPNIQLHKVQSAREMHALSLHHFPMMDAAILSAAVADYRPAEVSDVKIKKNQDEFTITLVKNPDIASELGKLKKPSQKLVGFALETHQEVEFAKKKMEAKNLDFIVLNSMKDEGAGFGTDTNKITLLFRNGDEKPLPLLSKKQAAEEIVHALQNYWN